MATSLPEYTLKTPNYGPDVWRGRQVRRNIPVLPSGHAKLDQHLPGHGWPLGALTELLSETPGAGEFSLLLPVARSWPSRISKTHIAWTSPCLPRARTTCCGSKA